MANVVTKEQKTLKAQEIGNRIKIARLECGGMKQPELAELVGVTQRSVQAWEQGETIPYRYGEHLSRVLGRPVAWFWNGDAAVEVRDETLDEILRELRGLRREVKALKAAVGALAGK